MAATRLELNLMRLLSRCEALAAERRDPEEWRLEKYVAALEDMLRELKKQSNLHQLKRLWQISSWLLDVPLQQPKREPQLLKQFICRQRLVAQDSLAIDDSEELNIRKRKGLASDEKQSAIELDAVLQHHQDMQEKLAEEMLSLARSLKNNTLAAQNVIKQDNQTLSHSLRMADQNFEKLKDESDRLEQHAKKSVNWLLWIMLIVVCFIFISMILFIRIFPKLK
ncbi:vesicle transport protein USE1 isoform X2 [Aptenodytes patagonicus]|uniref:vesicle transport protein USE1 isoform X2 n=1 Tax=Aptenodytes patagonicus TaxID=9234 RepID=UPI003FA08923